MRSTASTGYALDHLTSSTLSAESLGASDALLLALQRSDRAALRSVYQQHHETVRAFACRLVGHEADAEELVQETFLALPRAMRRFRGQCSLRTYLLSITSNLAKHFIRSAARRRAALQRYRESELASPDSNPSSPEREWQAERLAEKLTRAMDSLSTAQRLAFVLCEVEERSSSEAAQILDVPASTVRARVTSAKQKLRQLLEQENLS